MTDAPLKPTSRVPTSVWVGLSAACLGLIGLALGASFAPCILDDAYITFRYVHNAVTHHDLAFNAGGPPVEGFSSPAWFAMLTAGAELFGTPSIEALARALGTASFLVSLAAVFTIAYHDARDGAADGPLAALVAGVCWAFVPTVHMYMLTGLETLLFGAVVLLTLGAAAGRLPGWLGAAACASATWVRPEGAFLVASLALFALRHGAQRRRCVQLGVALVAGAVVLVAVRLRLFSDLLPNTYYAKTPDGMRGLEYVIDSLTTPWALLLALLGAAGAGCGGRVHRTYALNGLLWCGAAWFEGGDWMPAQRFMLPALASFCLAAAGIPRCRRTGLRWTLAAATLLFVALATVSTVDEALRQHRQRRGLVHEGQALASWLEAAGVGSVALMDIGRIGYATDLDIVDLAGLTDATIGRARGHHLRKRLDAHYVLDERAPTAVVIRVERPAFGPTGLDPNAAMTQPELDLLVSRPLRERYQLVLSVEPPRPRSPFYGLLVFLDKKFEVPRELRPRKLVVSVPPRSEPRAERDGLPPASLLVQD